MKLGTENNFLLGDWGLHTVEKLHSFYTCKEVKDASGINAVQCADKIDNKPIGGFIYWNNSTSKFVYDSDVGVPSTDKHRNPLIVWFLGDNQYTIWWKKIGIITYYTFKEYLYIQMIRRLISL